MRTTEWSVVQLLQCYLRAAELCYTGGRGVLEVGPGRCGLKAQVIGRIEELKAREREKEELLSELVPATEARGHHTGALKAVIGG